MPSVSKYQYVDVDFDWSDVLDSNTSDRSLNELAAALTNAGLVEKLYTALKQHVTALPPDPTGLDVEIDHIIQNLACGYPVDQDLKRIAFQHFGRVIY
jgi:hypothetical protein